MDSIDHDISLRIEGIVSRSVDASYDTDSEPSDDTELYGIIDHSALNMIYSYEQLDKPISNNEQLLLDGSIHLVPLDVFKSFKDLSHKCYFDIFYSNFSNVLMPFKSQFGLNPVRDILLSYAFRKDYLYYGILVCGARLSYNLTSLQDDQHYFSIFMKKAALMLNDFTFLQNYKPENQSLDIVHQRLEPLLLTILLLTSNNTSNLHKALIGHLRGAKELLRKVYIDRIFPETRILLFCKCWFTSFEIFDGLGAPYGSVLTSDDEFKNLILDVTSPHEVATLKSLTIIDDQDFNCIFGFHNDLLAPLIKLSNQVRLTFNKKNSFDPEIILQLSRQFQELCAITSKDQWKTVSNNSFATAGFLTILSKFLGVVPSNLIITDIVDHILTSLMTALLNDSEEPYVLHLLYWPILNISLNSSKIEHRENVEHLIKLLTSVGTGAARHVLQLVQKKWNNELSDKDAGFIIS